MAIYTPNFKAVKEMSDDGLCGAMKLREPCCETADLELAEETDAGTIEIELQITSAHGSDFEEDPDYETIEIDT